MASVVLISGYLPLAVAIFFGFVGKINCQNQIDFYDYKNGPWVWIHGSSRITTSCENMPYIANIKRRDNRVVTKHCVILYDGEDCRGVEHHLQPGDHSFIADWVDRTQSYRPCNDLSRDYPWRDLRAKFFRLANYKHIAVDTPIEPYCKNIPDPYKNEISSILTPICLILYAEANCNNAIQLRINWNSENLGGINDKVRSFRPCNVDDLKKSMKLKAKAVKFEFPTSNPLADTGTSSNSILLKQNALNNSTAEISTVFKDTKTVTDSFEVEIGESLSNMHEVHVEATASFEVSAGVEGLSSAKMAASLTAGYKYQQTTSSSTNRKTTHSEQKQVSIEQTMPVPPCSQIEMNWLAKRREGVPIPFVVTLEISGYVEGRRMSASEVKSKLQKGTKYVGDKDAFTVIAKVEEEMKADYAWETFLVSNAIPLDNCMGQNAKSNDEIQFFGKENYRDILHTSVLTDYCQSLPEAIKDKANSIRSKHCVILFSSETCDRIDDRRPYGQSTFKLLPGQGSTLPLFEKSSRSFISCKGYETKQKYWDSQPRVQFFKDLELTTKLEPLLDSLLLSTCTNLPDEKRQMISSVLPDDCVILFSEVDCAGENFTVAPYSTPTLRLFNDKTVSFRACADIEKGEFDYGNNFFFSAKDNLKIKSYKDDAFTELVSETFLLPTCNTPETGIWSKAVFIKTDVCVVIYSLPFCQGRSTVLEPHGSFHKSNKNDISSFRPCNPADLLEYSKNAYYAFFGGIALSVLILMIILTVVLVRMFCFKTAKSNGKYSEVPTTVVKMNNLCKDEEVCGGNVQSLIKKFDLKS